MSRCTEAWALLAIVALVPACHPALDIALGEPPEGARSLIIALRDETRGGWSLWAEDLEDGVSLRAALPLEAENTTLLAGYFSEPLSTYLLQEGALTPASADVVSRPLPRPQWLSRAQLTERPVSWVLEPAAEWPESLNELRLPDDRACGEYQFTRFDLPGTRDLDDKVMDAQLAVSLDPGRVLVGLGDGRLFVVTSTGVTDVTHHLPFAGTSSTFFPQRGTGPIRGSAWLLMNRGEVVEVAPDLEMIRHTDASTLSVDSVVVDGGLGPDGHVELYSVNSKGSPQGESLGQLARWTRSTGWVDLAWSTGRDTCEVGVQGALVLWLAPGKVSVIRSGSNLSIFELGARPQFQVAQLSPFVPPCTAIGHRGSRLGPIMALSTGIASEDAEDLYRWNEDRWDYLGKSPEQIRALFELSLPDGPRLLASLQGPGQFFELLPPSPRTTTLRACPKLFPREEDMLHSARLEDGVLLAGFSIRDVVRRTRRQNVIWVRRR